MIIVLLISYYIFIGRFSSKKNNNSRYVGRDRQIYTEYLSRFFGDNWLERPKLVSRLKSLLSMIKQVNIQKLLNLENLYKINNKSSIKNNENCKYLIMFLNPSDFPNECTLEESDKQNFSNNSSIIILEHDLNENLWRQELYKIFLERINNFKSFENHILLAKLAEDLGSELKGFINGKNFPKEIQDDYLNRLLDISLDLELSDNECRKNVNIRKLWEFGRLYNKLKKDSTSSVNGEFKYYEKFLAFVYYKCIYGINTSNNVNMTLSLGKDTQNQYLLNNFGVKNKVDSSNQESSFFEIVACYQLIPTLEIDNNELVSLGNLCEWEFEKKDFYFQSWIDQEKMRLIRQHINQIDEIYSKLDLIRLNHKYEQNLAKKDEMDDFQTSYFSQLILIVKRISKQIMIQHTYIYNEIGNYIDSSQKIDQNYETKTANSQENYSIVTTGVFNNISNQIKQESDSLNWKQLMFSIIENTQNILVREHINTMLINFLFDTIIRMLNPWISLFYQASFIINSYLSIISFLLVIVAILVCFNTIPCFRNEKDGDKKSQNIWEKVLRIYKANVMVILLNTIFILGGLLRYLYLPNEIELLNANITIIKAVNKVLNIILCPCVINIITSLSTVFSIFQWQLIWMSRKLSFSSLINL